MSNPYQRLRKGEVQKNEDGSLKKVSVCGYGPTLSSPEVCNKISERADYVFTVSGAYEYLKERGIVADYHLESDYRDHKVQYLKQCDPKTKFLIEASVCDNYFEKVVSDTSADNILQWNISYEPWYEHPEGEDTFTPYGNIGAHAVVMAYHMGFRDIGIFALDGNFFPDGRRHAGQTYLPPYGSREKDFVVEANGKQFRTSAPFCLYVTSMIKLIGELPGAKFQIFGDSLLSNYLMDVRALMDKRNVGKDKA